MGGWPSSFRADRCAGCEVRVELQHSIALLATFCRFYLLSILIINENILLLLFLLL